MRLSVAHVSQLQHPERKPTFVWAVVEGGVFGIVASFDYAAKIAAPLRMLRNIRQSVFNRCRWRSCGESRGSPSPCPRPAGEGTRPSPWRRVVRREEAPTKSEIPVVSDAPLCYSLMNIVTRSIR